MFYVTPEVAEVFCRDSTFSLGDLDRGKIICLRPASEASCSRADGSGNADRRNGVLQ
jgi:hypothetical protein